MTFQQAYFAAWTAAVAASAATTIMNHRRLRSGGERQIEALWFSAAADMVGVLFLGEFGVRALYSALTDTRMAEYHKFAMLWPTIAWILIGALLLLRSFALVPPWRRPLSLLWMRLCHVIAWGLASWAAVLSLVSI